MINRFAIGRVTRWLSLSTLILGMSVLMGFGCGNSNGTSSVSGTVTYQGKPVVGEIHFTPEDATGSARAGMGQLDPSGHYTLSSFTSGDGVKPGKYLVTIISKGPDKPISDKQKRLMMEEDAKGNGDPLIPKKYFDPLTSGLAADVKSSGDNVFNFELKD